MKGREPQSSPLIRPELPQDFKASQRAEIGAVVIAIVCLAAGALVIYGLVKSGDVPGWARVVLGLIALCVVAFGAVPATRVVRNVTMSDDGLAIDGMVRRKTVAWDRVAEIRFGAKSKSENSGGALKAGGIAGGLVGAVVGAVIDDATSSDHRQGNPFEDGRLRQHYVPSAELLADGGAPLARLGGELPWAFFTALRAEAAARKIHLVRVTPKASTTARRRR
jgi:hypothetical protein